MKIASIIANNIIIKIVSLMLAVLVWFYIAGHMYKQIPPEERGTSVLVGSEGSSLIVKDIPVYAKIIGDPAENFEVIIDKVAIKPSKTVIAGSTDKVKEISFLMTEPISVEGLSNSLKTKARIKDVPGCWISYMEPVDIYIPIRRKK